MRRSGTMQDLFLRYETFRQQIFPERRELFEKLKDSQAPRILLVTCSDSRVAPDLIMGSGPGDLFVCRNAGNIVPPWGEVTGGVSATVEYAVAVLKVEAIIVCGHSDCGAMKAILHHEHTNKLPAVRSWLSHSAAALHVVEQNYSNFSEDEQLEALIEENVLAQIENLETHPTVASRIRTGELDVYGWVYRIRTGEIVALDPEKGAFVPLTDSMPSATRAPRLRIRHTPDVK
jgi:carbonic anhydrase